MIWIKNEAKKLQNIFDVIINTNLTVKHLIQIKNGIIKLVSVNIKTIAHTKKIIAGMLAHVFEWIASIQKVLLILQYFSYQMWWNYML